MGMERVNLLPEEARIGFLGRLVNAVDQGFPRILAGTTAVLVTGGVLTAVVQAFLLSRSHRRMEGLRREGQLIRVETENLSAFAKQLSEARQQLVAQKEMLQGKLDYLSDVRGRSQVWGEILKDLRRNIPRGVWLTGLELTAERALRVVGGATDQGLVTQFMSALKDSSYFTDVTFNFTERDAIGKTPIVRFEVFCRVR